MGRSLALFTVVLGLAQTACVGAGPRGHVRAITQVSAASATRSAHLDALAQVAAGPRGIDAAAGLAVGTVVRGAAR